MSTCLSLNSKEDLRDYTAAQRYPDLIFQFESSREIQQFSDLIDFLATKYDTKEVIGRAARHIQSRLIDVMHINGIMDGIIAEDDLAIFINVKMQFCDYEFYPIYMALDDMREEHFFTSYTPGPDPSKPLICFKVEHAIITHIEDNDGKCEGRGYNALSNLFPDGSIYKLHYFRNIEEAPVQQGIIQRMIQRIFGISGRLNVFAS